MNFKYIVIYSSYSKRKKRKKINSKELWNLDITIIEWLVPRLKAFREQTEGYPGDITWDFESCPSCWKDGEHEKEYNAVNTSASCSKQ